MLLTQININSFTRREVQYNCRHTKSKKQKQKGKQKKIERPAIGGRGVAVLALRRDAASSVSLTLAAFHNIQSHSKHVRRIVSLQDATEIILSESFELRT